MDIFKSNIDKNIKIVTISTRIVSNTNEKYKKSNTRLHVLETTT